MIISRTPVRVSFCGGGTDLPAYYMDSENGGLVTSMALAKHIHVTVNKRFDSSVRVSYSKTEIVNDFEELLPIESKLNHVIASLKENSSSSLCDQPNLER